MNYNFKKYNQENLHELLKNKNNVNVIKKIFNKCFKRYMSGNEYIEYLTKIADMQKDFFHSLIFLMVAFDNDELVGFISYDHSSILIDRKNGQKQIKYQNINKDTYIQKYNNSERIGMKSFYSLCRSSDDKYKGIGRLLLENAENEIKKNGTEMAYIIPDNKKLEKYYKSIGYAILNKFWYGLHYDINNPSYKIYAVLYKKI